MIARPRPAFTLVELLMVVVVLSILAAVVTPQFFNAGINAKSSALKQDLKVVRTAIEVYKFDHEGRYPDWSKFEIQLTTRTNPDGSSGGTPSLGPYLQRIPDWS